MRLWRVSSSLRVKLLPHCSQRKGRSPATVTIATGKITNATVSQGSDVSAQLCPPGSSIGRQSYIGREVCQLCILLALLLDLVAALITSDISAAFLFSSCLLVTRRRRSTLGLAVTRPLSVGGGCGVWFCVLGGSVAYFFMTP